MNKVMRVLVMVLLSAGGAAMAQTVSEPVDDRWLNTALTGEGGKLVEGGKTVAVSALRGQLQRTTCKVSGLPSPARRELGPVRCFSERRDQVIVIGGLFKCSRCSHWHASVASAFPIAAPDVFVTNYHVFSDTNAVAYVGMTRQGKVQPVVEILAANKLDDIAIIRIPGAGLKPVALRNEAAVGEAVTLISHAANRFYSYSAGVIARYSLAEDSTRQKKLMMEVTADFAKGSSGAPILDSRGNAVGIVAATEAVFYNDHEFGSVQMVFKHCVPSARIKALMVEAED